MPELAHVLTEEDIRARAPMRLDLGPYLAIVDEVAGGGVGGELTLDDDDNQRAQERRMSLAAKERGYELTRRRAPERSLRFVLARPGEARPGGRPRRSEPSETATSSGGRGRQTARRGRS